MTSEESFQNEVIAFQYDELGEAARGRIQRISPDEWYRQGVGALLDGVVWEAMKHQKKAAYAVLANRRLEWHRILGK